MNSITRTGFIFLFSFLLADDAFTFERSCSGRIFAQITGTNYQIDLLNHLSVTGSGPSTSLARWNAALNLQWCGINMWVYRQSVKTNGIAIVSQWCPETSGISPLAADIESRLIKLACSKTWRNLVNANVFAVDLMLETRGEEGCGGNKEKIGVLQMGTNFPVTVSQCASQI